MMALFIYTLVVVWFHRTGHQLLRFPVPALVHQEGRTIVRRYVDDPETGRLRGKNPTTASRTVWPENLDRPAHRASQPNRVSGHFGRRSGLEHLFTIDSPGGISPAGRSRSASKSTKRELRSGTFYFGFVVYASTAFGWVYVMRRHLKLATIGAVYSVSMIVLLTCIGAVIFRQPVNADEVIGLVMAIGSLILLMRFT